MSTLRWLEFAGVFCRTEKQSGELEDSGGLEHAESLDVAAMKVDVRAGLFYGWLVSTEG